MYTLIFDEKHNTFRLVPLETSQNILSLRPVFFEELDLLGFNEYWSYPRCQEPLLWCNIVNRTYYYKGQKVAKITGGGFFERPKLEIYEKNLKLKPVNLKYLITENLSILKVTINAALDFIVNTCEKNKNYVTVVGFSGGKDSTVLLDLVQRAIEPSKFSVIFNDTSMELSSTYEFYSNIQKKYENLKFINAKHEKSALLTWRKFGPPSRIQRWCCTVHKMVPNVKILKSLFGNNAKILFFDGIRADESPKRQNLDIQSQGKYFRQKNVHPLLDWTVELVWLYIFFRNLPINEAYRFGVSRVGCIVCPFESEWREAIIWLKYREEAKPYIEILREYAEMRGIKDTQDFIKEGNWKVRPDGKGWYKSKINVNRNNGFFQISFEEDRDFLKWTKVLGATFINNTLHFQLKNKDYSIKIRRDNETNILVPEKEREVYSLMKKLAAKSVYCVRCGFCEVVCPKDALLLNDKIRISDSCSNCLLCFSSIDKGCLVAKSLDVPLGGSDMMEKFHLRDYHTFGLRKIWLQEFFKDPERWLSGENSCGPVQFEAMKKWLNDAELIRREKRGYRVTELTELLSQLGADDLFVWGVIWVNLARNSSLISWYVNELEWGKYYKREQILELMGNNLSLATRKNALQSLSEIFRHTPLGKELGLGVLNEKNGKILGIEKAGVKEEKVTDSFTAVVLYSLYRLKETKGNYLSLKMLYEDRVESPANLFGLERELFRKILRGLQESYGKKIIAVDLAMDLDNIVLNFDFDILGILRSYVDNSRKL